MQVLVTVRQEVPLVHVVMSFNLAVRTLPCPLLPTLE